MDMRKPTKAELDLYPHVDFTSDAKWIPDTLDDEVFFDAQESEPPTTSGGEIAAHPSTRSSQLHEDQAAQDKVVDFTPRGFLGNAPDLHHLRQYLNWVSIERIQSTLKNTTQ